MFWLLGDSLHTSLQALGIDHQDDDGPFTLEKGMEQLKDMSRSLRRSSGSNDRDPAGIMMQLKDFAKVSTHVHVEERLVSPFFALVERVALLFKLLHNPKDSS